MNTAQLIFRMFVGSAALVVCAANGVAATDAYEPDDTSSAAKVIAKGQTQNRTIHAAGNADWVKFTVTGPGTYNLTVETAGASGDTQVWLYKEAAVGRSARNAGELVAYDDNSGAGLFSKIAVSGLIPLTYYIKVQEKNNDGTIPAYTLRVNWAVPATPAADAYEPDQRGSEAKLISNGQVQRRTIHAAGNHDIAKFRVGGFGARKLVVETAGASGDTTLRLVNTTGEQQLGYDDDSGTGAFSRITRSFLDPGTYYVVVQEYQNRLTIPAYTLRVRWTAATTPVPDNFERDNVSGSAQEIVQGQTQRRTIHAAGNRDWAKFTVGGIGGQNIVLETAGARGDTQMWLYRANAAGAAAGTKIAYNNNGGIGDFSRIRLASLPPGKYFIRVQENGNNGIIAAYTLRAQWTAAAAPVPDAYESDDSPESAKTIANGQTQSRTIHVPDDTDRVKFVVGGTEPVFVRLETAGPAGDTRLWLFNSANQLVEFDDNSGNGNFSLIQNVAVEPGTYFIVIDEYGHDAKIPAYTLKASWTEARDGYEPDDDKAHAMMIANGETQNRTIHAPGNWDWVRFTVGGAGLTNLRIETDGASGGTLLTLYDAHDNFLALDDNSGNGDHALITRAALPAGTYYIAVCEDNNDGVLRSYTLRATWTDR